MGRGWSKTVFSSVDNVSLEIRRGETLGLVGESGSGKSTLGRCLLKLIDWDSGDVQYQGLSLKTLRGRDLRRIRPKIQMIFQDPMACLNPRLSVRAMLEEPIMVHRLATTYRECRQRVESLADLVGLRPDQLDRYPHEFSGGQRQRIGIARAVACQPDFIVCDEPVSSLDVSIQAQILNLLKDVQTRLGITYLFISHDLRVVQYMSHQIAVMYLGKIVETAKSTDFFASPQHPYSQMLLRSVPDVDRKTEWGDGNFGEPPELSRLPRGCSFHPRCAIAQPRCLIEVPRLEPSTTEPNSHASCFFPGRR